ncbi:hypothetical protein ACXPWS_07685 [Mycobacterium sp. BMJ-28]
MPWAPAYATADELEDWLDGGDTVQLSLALEAASRAIDKATGRQFGKTDTAETWYYTGDYHCGETVVRIDDTFDADLTVAGVNVFTLYPRNPKGKPWRQIRIPGSVGSDVAVTAVWGWTAVPDAIKLATLIQAGRFYARRDNPAGPLSVEKVDDIQRNWSAVASQDLDSDVLTSVKPFRKLWVAA